MVTAGFLRSSHAMAETTAVIITIIITIMTTTIMSQNKK